MLFLICASGVHEIESEGDEERELLSQSRVFHVVSLTAFPSLIHSHRASQSVRVSVKEIEQLLRPTPARRLVIAVLVTPGDRILLMATIDTWNPSDGIMPTKEEQEAEAKRVEDTVPDSLTEQVRMSFISNQKQHADDCHSTRFRASPSHLNQPLRLGQ